MAVIQKAYSRAKPIVESSFASPGTTYTDSGMKYVASLCVPDGPPYAYFELVLSEAEMLVLVTSWMESLRQHLRQKAKPSKAEGHIGQELAPDPERRVNGNGGER